MTTPRRVGAIGLGPFNLGLAALAAPHDDIDVIGFDTQPAMTWHPGMLLPEATIQVPFLADLVSLADPTSDYSFLNYLKHTNQLYKFYIRESFFPYRIEYSKYCGWVADQLSQLYWGHHVTGITTTSDGYQIHSTSAGTNHTTTVSHLVIGTGTAPAFPTGCPSTSARVHHSADYAAIREALWAEPSVTVVGSGQSAAEVFLDLLNNATTDQVHWITRSARFHPMEVPQLTLEMTSPDYLQYFHQLTTDQQHAENATQQHLFKGISDKTLHEIYETLYRRDIHGHSCGTILANTEVAAVAEHLTHLDLTLRHNVTGDIADHTTTALICATGYQPRPMDFLAEIADDLVHVDGHLVADDHHRLDGETGTIFSQNTSASPHDLTGPDLGMGAWRNSRILAQITGRELYPTEKTIAFQQFTVEHCG